MEVIQLKPSKVLLLQGPGKLTIYEQTFLPQLIKILGFWIGVGTVLFCLFSFNQILFGLRAVSLMICLTAVAMTLVSWVVEQAYVFEVASNTVTWVRIGILGATNFQTYFLSDIKDVNLVPKLNRDTQRYYISLQLRSQGCLSIDLTTSAGVDREIAYRILQFLKLPLHNMSKEPSLVN